MPPLSDRKRDRMLLHYFNLVHRSPDTAGFSDERASSGGNSQLRTMSPTSSVRSQYAGTKGDFEGDSQLRTMSPTASVRSQHAFEGNSPLQTMSPMTGTTVMSQQRVSAAAALIHELVSNPMAGPMSQQSVASAAALIHELVSVHWCPNADEDDDHHHHQAKKAKTFSEIDAEEDF